MIKNMAQTEQCYNIMQTVQKEGMMAEGDCKANNIHIHITTGWSKRRCKYTWNLEAQRWDSHGNVHFTVSTWPILKDNRLTRGNLQ